MQLHNLQLLSEVHRGDECRQHLRYCCRASDAWFHSVHDPAVPLTDAQLLHAGNAFAEMMATPAVSAEATAPSSSAQALQRILETAHVTANPNWKEFPGPMCSPLCKKDAVTLRQQPYTVTEKSDGVRVVVVALWVADFPSWECRSSLEGCGDASHLSAVFALEEGRQRLQAQLVSATAAPSSPSSSSSAVRAVFKGQTWWLERASQTSTSASQEDTTMDEEVYTLRNADTDVSLSFARQRRGRHFAYAVDRSLNAAYLFLDDHTSSAYRTFVLDGELMCVRDISAPTAEATEQNSAAEGKKTDVTSSAARPSRLLLGAFDLFTFTPAADGAAATTSLVNATMMERYELLKTVMATTRASPADGGEGHVRWFAKTMWRVADIAACLSKLYYSAAHRCFFFDGPHGPTENDGLIFTPDHFPISVGSSSVQLKWKWRHLLSIDWLLHASDKAADVYTVSLFFMKKNYGHRDDVLGHWRLRRPMTIQNPHGFDIPVNAPVVAECAYDMRHHQWYIQRLRHDKSGANSIVTAISVYESLVEDISLPRLLELLQVDAPDAAQQAEALETEAAARLSSVTEQQEQQQQQPSAAAPAFDVAQAEKFATACVTLRAIRESRGNTELYLNAYTNTTNKAVKFPLPFPLRKIRDCVGLGYDPVTATTTVPTLEEALYIQLGNAGGCYAWSDFTVDAFYNGETGYWELIRLNPRGNNKDAIFDNVIEHLDWLLRCGEGGGSVNNTEASKQLVQQVLQRKRDRPLVVAAAATVDATQQTSQHYGAVAKELANAERSDLRRFNNWVKSVLISSVAAAVRKTLRDPAKLHVVDLCCGRGGDLLKWQHLHPAFLFMTDASVECVAEAAARYSTAEGQSTKSSGGKKRGFPAFFAVHDAFDSASGLRTDLLKRGPFQVISCQFSMHYGCRSAESIRYFVRAVADALAVRGRFVGTTVCDAELLTRAKSRGAAFGNSVYNVHFSDEAFAQVQAADFDAARLPFGVPYSTTVERSVQDMKEYVVPWPLFVQLCSEHQLRLVQDDNFGHFYRQNRETEEGRALLAELQRKRGADGETVELPLSAEEAEAVHLYRLFVFEKTDKTA